MYGRKSILVTGGAGLGFITACGPWGRSDMALWIFTRKILAGEPPKVSSVKRALISGFTGQGGAYGGRFRDARNADMKIIRDASIAMDG